MLGVINLKNSFDHTHLNSNHSCEECSIGSTRRMTSSLFSFVILVKI